VSKRSGMVNSVTRNWQPPAEQQALQDSLAQNTALTDPFADPVVNGTGTAIGPGSDGPAGTNSTDVSPAPLSQAEIASSIDPGIVNSNEVSATPATEVGGTSGLNQYENSAAAHWTETVVPSSADYVGNPSSGDSSFNFASSSEIAADSSPSPDHSSSIFSLESNGLRQLNNNFNENSASRYVTDQGVKQITGEAQGEAKIVDDASATGIFGTDGNAAPNTEAIQKFENDYNNLPAVSVEEVLHIPNISGNIDNEVSAWVQKVQNSMGAVKAKAHSLYNYLTGNTDCTQPGSLFRTDCAQ
jgi:hypothetical protein